MIWWYWSRYSTWTCMCMTYKKQKLVTSQLGCDDVLHTVTRRPWIWTCTNNTSATLTGALVWNNIWRNSTETRPRLGRVEKRRRKRTWRKETSPVPVETAVRTVPTRTPRGWFQYGEIWRQRHEGWFFYSIGGQSQDQVYCETEQRFHVYQEREGEVCRYRQLFCPGL